MEPATIVCFGLACAGAGFSLGVNLGLWHERRRVTQHVTNLSVTMPDLHELFGPDEEFEQDDEDDDEPDYGPDSDFWKARRN